MSLLQCPECGKEVSSTSEKCIHCGAKFTICPDCGKPYLGEGKCPNCISQIPAKPPKPLINPFRRWREDHPRADYIVSHEKRLRNIATVASGVILLIGIILFFIWQSKGASTSPTVRIILIIFSVLFGLGWLFDGVFYFILPVWARSSMLRWLKRTNIDAIAYLKSKKLSYKQINKGNFFQEYKLLAHAEYEKANPKRKKLIDIPLIYMSLYIFALAFVFIVSFPYALATQELFMDLFSDSMQKFLIILFFIYAAGSLILFVINLMEFKKRKTWITKNIVE